MTPEFSIRASVIPTCNMNCEYCPKDTGMENYCPDIHSSKHLTPDDYSQVLNNLIEATGTNTVAITGGEPFINKDLPDIIENIRPNLDRIELNTNGTLVSKDNWASVVASIDEIKVSLDTLSPEQFSKITKLPEDNLYKVLNFIETANTSEVPLRLNCVVMKENKNTIMDLIKYAKEKHIRLNLLDFYWTEEKSTVWNEQFIPVETIFDQLEAEFGAPVKFEKFGCDFVTFNDGDIAVVRTKSSFGGTMRAPKCETCTEYCQEGIFCLRFSSQGWVTTCPSKSESKGVLIKPEDTIEDIKKLIKPLVEDIKNSVLDISSFKKLEERRGLNPQTKEAKKCFNLI